MHSVDIEKLPLCFPIIKEAERQQSADMTVTEAPSVPLCDVCSRQDNEESQQLLTTTYCCTCEQTLCDYHLKVSSEHKECLV